MLKIFKNMVIVFLSLSVGHAESDQGTQDTWLNIDSLHSSISETIVEWSYMIDTTLSNWLEEKITHTTDLEDNNAVPETDQTDTENNSTILETDLADVDGNSTMTKSDLTDVEDNTTVPERTISAVKSNKKRLVTQKRHVEKNTAPIQDHEVPNETEISEKGLVEEVGTVDRFFQNDKYLDQTDETYIRIRSENYVESKGSNDFGASVRVQMPLSRTKKRFKIFVDDLTLENADEILKDTQDTPDIGIHYFASRHKILSRYSIGFSGIDPFVKARFNMPIEIDNWLIDPIQTFKYSIDDQFEEETNVYFDRKIDDSSFFRVLLHRKTKEEIEGMDYALSVQCFKIGKRDTGFGLAQSFLGNTEYRYSTEQGTSAPKLKKYGGIHEYVTSFSWRANIWRKWFYYEIRPSVSFHKQYEYQANYRVRLFFDFYFGDHHKN